MKQNKMKQNVILVTGKNPDMNKVEEATKNGEQQLSSFQK